MARSRTLVLSLTAILLVGMSLMTSCGATATPTPVPTKAATAVPPTTAPKATVAPTTAPTQAPPTSTPAPAPGGKLVIGVTQDPPTLDPQMATFDAFTKYMGASLIAWAPDGQFMPYLAESWTASDDGLVWDFNLRRDVKFHDGTPFTARDYEYTFARALDPDTGSPVIPQVLGSVTQVEAVSDYVLRLTLSEPYAPLLLNLALSGFMCPLSQAWVEKWGDQFARHPMSVGPYVFKEWKTGQSVTLERNPDYNWGPSYAHEGPWYIQTIEFLIVPEHSTVLAGLEAGEIDNSALLPQDLARIKATGNFQILEALQSGMDPSLCFNSSKPPFDDVRVRLAFNYAIDRESLLKVAVGSENAVPQRGPISKPVLGYWSEVEKIGYTYDLAKAQDLMAQAGYTMGADGLLEKDGKPLKLDFLLVPNAAWTKVAEVLKEQYKALGVDLTISQQETGVYQQQLFGGEYTISIVNWSYPDGDILYLILHSSGADGGLNVYKVKDPDLDTLLELSRTTTDATKRLDVFAQIQKRILEQGYVGPLYTPKIFEGLSNKVKGAILSPVNSGLYLEDAYIETK